MNSNFGRHAQIVLILAIVSLFPEIALSQWTQWPASEGGNGHWYRLTATGTWQAAEAEAVANGGHLVTMNDQAEQDWLNATFPFEDGPLWIGFWQDTTDPGYSEPAGGWKWISGEPVTLTNWAGGEPNEAPPAETNEDRAQMHAFAPGRWQDVPGNASYALRRGIIERSDAQPPITPPQTSQWIQWPKSDGGNGHWYQLTATGPWQDAEAEAVANSGHLVTINNQVEQDWLNATFPFADGPLWIGLNQVYGSAEPDSGWQWSNGDPVTYTNWASGEPNEAPPSETNEDRAQMHAFAPGRWQDVPGNASFALRRGIIERRDAPTVPPNQCQFQLCGICLVPTLVLSFVGIVGMKQRFRRRV